MMSTDDIHNVCGGVTSSAAVVCPRVKPASSTISASIVEPVTSTVDLANSTVVERGPLSDMRPVRRPQSHSTQRRRRKLRRLQGSQHRSVQEPNSNWKESERRLTEIINQRAMAMKECTYAMRKMTAAADRLTTVFERLATILSQQLTKQKDTSSSSPRKRARIITPSDSDSN